MARGEQSDYIKCPAKYMLEWDGGNGTLKMWNASTKEKILLELPFDFAWVEEFGFISGYSNNLRTSFHSNEVHGRDLKSKPFEVFHFEKGNDGSNKKIIDAEGLYHDIKPQLAQLGASYHKMIYAIAVCDNGPVKRGDLIRILASPAFCQEWYDFNKSNKVDSGSVIIDGCIDRQNGNIKYKSPVFVMEEIEAEMDKLALDAVKPLKAYYTQSASEPEQVDDDGAFEDDVPF